MNGIESFFGAGVKDQLDGDTAVLSQYIRMKEFHLYGASRLGILNQNDTLKRADLHFALTFSDPNAEPELFVETQDYIQYAADSIYSLKLGKKLYEGTNHLGNVLVTFSDKRLATCLNDTIYYYRADLRSAQDFSAFHAALDDRQWFSTADSGVYRFGASNGQEKDNEIYGAGNSYSAEFWQYDSRLARRWNVDIVVKHGESPYSKFSNNPISLLDPNGADTIKGPNGQDLNIGSGYSQTKIGDDYFLVGEGLKTKIWNAKGGAFETGEYENGTDEQLQKLSNDLRWEETKQSLNTLKSLARKTADKVVEKVENPINGLGLFAAGEKAAQLIPGKGGGWEGANGKWYNNSVLERAANGKYVRGREFILRSQQAAIVRVNAQMLTRVGNKLFYAGVAIGTYKAVTNLVDGNYAGATASALGVGAAFLIQSGTVPGLIIGGLFYAIDYTVGVENIINGVANAPSLGQIWGDIKFETNRVQWENWHP